jgi:isoquinoline 1-oxidoreductase beta subunit
MLRWNVAKALSLDESAVDIHPTLVGGGFGRKAECMAGVQAALIARDLKRPVQLIWSREEEFAAGPMRPAAIALMRARLDAGGGIEAWDARVACGSVGQSFMRRNLPILDPGDGPDGASISGVEAPYYAMGARTSAHLNVKVPQRLGFWRSVEHSFTGFFVESFIDELAVAAGRDPMLYRLALLKDSPRHAAVLRAAGEAAGYAAGSGMGIALHESFNSIVAEVAEVEPGPEPRVRRVACAIDCGRAINPDQVRAQMEGSILFGQSAALWGRVGFAGGALQTANLDGYRLAQLSDAPAISVTILGNAGRAPGGVGEPGLPPIAPAIANALAAAGARPRALPIVRA